MTKIKLYFNVSIMPNTTQPEDTMKLGSLSLNMTTPEEVIQYAKTIELPYAPIEGMKLMHIAHPVPGHDIVLNGICGDEEKLCVFLKGCSGKRVDVLAIIDNLNSGDWETFDG